MSSTADQFFTLDLPICKSFKMKLWQKKNAQKIIELFIYCSLFALFIQFFFKEQYEAFVSGRSTIASRYIRAEVFEFPTITICLHPATKLSISQKYGFKNIHAKFYAELSNTSLYERFDELSYILNKDFIVQNHDGQKFRTGTNIIAETYGSRNLSFDVTALRTYYYGTCYKVQPYFEILNLQFRMLFSVSLNQNLMEVDKPHSVMLHFTSNKTWLGLLDNMWPQFEPLTVRNNMNEEFTQLRTSVTEKYYQEELRENGKCLRELLLSKNCSNPCNLLTFGDLQPCESIDQLNCMWTNLFSMDEYRDCYKTNLATTYNLNQRIDNPPHQSINLLHTEIYLAMWNNMKEVQEEVPLLTPEVFVGSVGGSLGLLFGFSISGSLFFFIQLLINKVFQ